MRRAIPKKAVKPLIEHCNKIGGKTGRSGAQVFADYLRLMKKYADYFFGDAWPPKKLAVSSGLWLYDDESEFLGESRSFREEVERFTVLLLKRNLSLEGFSGEQFNSDFDFYGKMLCYGCGVPDALHLREYLLKLDESNAEIAEKHRLEPNDAFNEQIYNYRFAPDVVREAKMSRVELEFLDAYGGTEGKTCSVRNKCLCPYGAKSGALIKLGECVKSVWRLVEYYHQNWHSSRRYTPSPSDAKWIHFGEEDFLDVTSREDILRALEDGRIERIADEFKKYKEALGHS